MSEEKTVCGLCGEPMPAGEEMFNYHGYSGPCPKPPSPREAAPEEIDRIESMTEAELDAELRSNGIDPEKLIQNTFQKVCVALMAKSERIKQLERVADEIHKLLLESQTSIGGDWRTRRDAALASYAKWKEK